MSVAELKETKTKLIAEGRSILDNAGSRPLTEEERAKHDSLTDQVVALNEQIETEERKEYQEQLEAAQQVSVRKSVPVTPGKAAYKQEQRGDVLRNWFAAGTDVGDMSPQAQYRAAQHGVNLFAKNITLRAQSKGSNSAGGYTTNKSFFDTLWATVAYQSGLLGAVNREVSENGNSRLYATKNSTNRAVVVDENTDMSTQDQTFGQVEIPCWKFSSKQILTSIELLQDSLIDFEQTIANELADRFTRGLEEDIITGDGTSTIKGILTSSSAGVTGASLASGPTYANIVDLKMSVDIRDIENGVFVLGKSTLAFLMKLVDSQGRPIWNDGLANGGLSGGAPPTILNRPYYLSDYMPAWGASAKAICYFNPKLYQFRQAMELNVARSDERYFEYGQVAWCGIGRFGGSWIGPQASIKHLAVAAS
jgi:HK97 family phage major capsid protein